MTHRARPLTNAGLAALARESGREIAERINAIRYYQLNPACCHDCGVNTTPVDGYREWYMVWPEVWFDAGMSVAVPCKGGGFLCVGCLETRLRRPLTARDFMDEPINEPNAIDTPRLATAKRRAP